jgi:hypothetical protein
MNDNRFYVYAYYSNNVVFYIGKGAGTRIYNKTNRCKTFINKIKESNWHYIKLAENLTEEDAYELEEIIIETIGLNNLVNIVPGGLAKYKIGRNMQGINNPRYGAPVSEITKEKISKAHLGKKVSEESKKKMSLSRCFMYEIDGMVFNSGIEASKYFNVSQSTISRWVKNNYKQSKIISKFYASNNKC